MWRFSAELATGLWVRRIFCKKKVSLNANYKMGQKRSYIIVITCLVLCGFVSSTEEEYRTLAAKYAGTLKIITKAFIVRFNKMK